MPRKIRYAAPAYFSASNAVGTASMKALTPATDALSVRASASRHPVIASIAGPKPKRMLRVVT